MVLRIPAAGETDRRAARAQAVLLILGAYLCFACLDTTAKYLGAALAPLQIVWMRYLTHSAFAIAAQPPARAADLVKTRRPILQIQRGLFLLGATAFNFVALRYLQLAETTAIVFLGPFLVTALAGPMLGEWAGPRRWAAIAVGFTGALFIARPGADGLHPAMLLSVGSTMSYAFYIVLTRSSPTRRRTPAWPSSRRSSRR